MKRPLLLDALDQEANKGKESYQYDQIYPHETDDFTLFAIEVLFEVGAVELLVHLAIVVVFF